MKLDPRPAALALLAALGLAGCLTESHSQLPGPKSAIITRTMPARGWEARDDGRLAGSVLLYADPADESNGYYSVRNAHGQVLGMVDLDGRAWRYRLHEEEPEWIGTGTVLEGVRRILGTSALCALEPAALELLLAEH